MFEIEEHHDDGDDNSSNNNEERVNAGSTPSRWKGKLGFDNPTVGDIELGVGFSG